MKNGVSTIPVGTPTAKAVTTAVTIGFDPAEGVWNCPRDKLLNLAVGSIDQLTLVIRSQLKQMQYRPVLLYGFVAETGPALEPP